MEKKQSTQTKKSKKKKKKKWNQPYMLKCGSIKNREKDSCLTRKNNKPVELTKLCNSDYANEITQ
jgi:hypothetical protein